MKMNKISILLLVATFLPLVAFSQIGIYTENPQSLFHIDVLANNTGSVPSASQQIDDVYIGMMSDDAVLSLGELPQNDAQLSLTGSNKAFFPNRVALKGTTDLTTVPNPQTGMMVYNTAKVSGTKGVSPSLYLFEDGEWKYSFTEDVKRLQMNYLLTAIDVPRAASTDYNTAVKMNFGNDILIPEEGAYGVGVSVIGRPTTTITAPTRGVLFVWLMANDVPVDVAELNMPGFINGGYFSYTVFLGGMFSVNDKLSLRISHYKDSSLGEPISLSANNTTFMMYWRLSQTS